MSKKNNIKKHLKDIDFRTREQRRLEWQKDFNYWINDLSDRPNSQASKIQLPILINIYNGLLEEPEETVDKILKIKNYYVQLKKHTAEDLHVFRLYSSVAWYVE